MKTTSVMALLAAASNVATAFKISNVTYQFLTPGGDASSTFSLAFNITDPESTVPSAYCKQTQEAPFGTAAANYIPCDPPSYGFSFRPEQAENNGILPSFYLNIMHTITVAYPLQPVPAQRANLSTPAVRVAPFTYTDALPCTSKSNPATSSSNKTCAVPATAPELSLSPGCVGTPCFSLFLAPEGWQGDAVANSGASEIGADAAGTKLTIRRDATDGGASLNLPLRKGTLDSKVSSSAGALASAAIYPTAS